MNQIKNIKQVQLLGCSLVLCTIHGHEKLSQGSHGKVNIYINTPHLCNDQLVYINQSQNYLIDIKAKKSTSAY
jgi:hypothetical protein